jgi:ATP-dependent Clp protease adaptor protein ClpS
MDIVDTHKLIIHNDNEHDFTYVMACLIRICNHDPIQAEQCTLITHHKGKCHIKNGSWYDMQNLSEDLVSLGLKVSIEEHESHLH